MRRTRSIRIVQWLALAMVLALAIVLVGSMWYHITVRIPGTFRIEVSGAAARMSWPPGPGTAPPGPTQWDFDRVSVPQDWWFSTGPRVGWTEWIVPLWAPLALAGAIAGALWWPRRPWSPRNKAGYCRACGYDLRGSGAGSSSSICPECGEHNIIARLLLALRRALSRLAWVPLLLLALTSQSVAQPPPASQPAIAPADADTDGDGLPDYWETHKYHTDPHLADSDLDGKNDSDPDERREYAYSVRAVMHIMKPYSVECMNDDFQDARVIAEQDDYAEVEFTIYPFNTCAADQSASADWHVPPAHVAEFIAPGITNNFDESLQNEIWTALMQAGIRPDGLSDREFAKRAAKYFDRHAQFEDGFTTFAVTFDNDKPIVPPDMQALFDRELQRLGRTMQEQFDHELLGAGMFRNRTRGSCTSSAIYFSTCMRAVGIPTRTIVCVPVIDASDPGELGLVDGIKNEQVREAVQQAANTLGDSWASHTFNEVWIGGRWCRLNTDRLDQPILDANLLGLMVHVNTFIDMADAGLIAWGRRNALTPEQKARDICGHSNPYSCVALSDQVGMHAKPDLP